MRVVEKSVLTLEIPVPKAGVWAVSMTDAASIAAEQDMAALTTKQGIFLGWTTEDGYVSPTPRFIRPGQYWLVAVKDGYVPGISKIMVVPLPVVTPTVLPLPAAPAITNKAPGNTSIKSAATAPVRPVAMKPAVSE
jgi:hypothetical protein